MVRLKVNAGNVSMLRAEISIPYGAIKSLSRIITSEGDG